MVKILLRIRVPSTLRSPSAGSKPSEASPLARASRSSSLSTGPGRPGRLSHRRRPVPCPTLPLLAAPVGPACARGSAGACKLEAPRRTAAGGRGQERCTVYAGCVLGGPERAQRIGLSKLFLDCPRAAQADEIDPHRQTRSTRTGRRDRGRLRSRPSRSIARVLLPTSRDSERGRPAPRDWEHSSRSAVRSSAESCAPA